MKKRSLALFMAIVTLISAFALASCRNSESVSIELDGDLKERIVYLIEGSRELNTVFFGAGLPVYRREGDLIAERKTVYQSMGISGYLNVTEQSDLQRIDEIKAAASNIFSEPYLAALYETAFDGVVLGNDGAYLRFHEDDNFLYQNMSATDFGLCERIYDYSTMTVVAPSDSKYINVSIESYSLSDGRRADVILSFVYERGNWYLDSPTY